MQPISTKARGLAQHGWLAGWLEESNPADVILYVMDRPCRSGSLASSRRHSGGADPASTTPTRGEVGQCAAMRAAATVVPTVGREGRSGAVSAAAGAAGESSESSFENINGNRVKL